MFKGERYLTHLLAGVLNFKVAPLCIVIFSLTLTIPSCFRQRTASDGFEAVEFPPFSIGITLPSSSKLRAEKVKVSTIPLSSVLAGLPEDSPFLRDFVSLKAFAIEPLNLVESEPATLSLSMPGFKGEGTILFLFYVGKSGYLNFVANAEVLGSGDAIFKTRTFGKFLVAENRHLIPQRYDFSAHGYADRVVAQVPARIKFSAVAHGGTGEPTFTWDFGDGSRARGGEVLHTYYREGDYKVGLFAEDEGGVKVEGRAPFISARNSRTPLRKVDVSYLLSADGNPLEIRFFAEVHGGLPLEDWRDLVRQKARKVYSEPFIYNWKFGDGATSVEQSPVHKYARSGLYRAELAILDRVGSKLVKTFFVDLRHCKLEVEPSVGVSPLTASFQISALGMNPETQISIDFGDGASLEFDTRNPAITHVYRFPGTFLPSVTITDLVDGTLVERTFGDARVVVLTPPKPTITLLSRSEGQAGDKITVYGYDFGVGAGENASVFFSGSTGVVQAEIISWMDTALKVKVPAGAKTGEVYVLRDGIRSNARRFWVK